jgi:hypothetical protein
LSTDSLPALELGADGKLANKESKTTKKEKIKNRYIKIIVK